MPPRRAQNTPDQKHQHSRRICDRVSRYVGKVANSTSVEGVHRFRTNSRRLEVLVSQFGPDNGNARKLLKLLSKLRKKAGRVRDLDVQIALLKELRVPDRQEHRTRLLGELVDEQARRGRKLSRSFDADRSRELRKRLRKAHAEMTFDGADPLRLALDSLPKPAQGALTEPALHACRLAVKRSRYLAELAPDSAEAKLFVEEVRRAQDAIGEWHDVLKLKQRAEKMFGEVHDSPLVAALHNLGRAKLRRAVSVLWTALSRLSELRTPEKKMPRKAQGREAVAQRAVA